MMVDYLFKHNTFHEKGKFVTNAYWEKAFSGVIIISTDSDLKPIKWFNKVINSSMIQLVLSFYEIPSGNKYIKKYSA